jgi:hypothetical protein
LGITLSMHWFGHYLKNALMCDYLKNALVWALH